MSLVELKIENNSEYGKIDTLFERDEKTFVVDPSKLKHPVYATISTWDVTEKIDGTNIRVMLSVDGVVTFGGRTNAAQIPADLVAYLMLTFTPEKMKAAFWSDGQPVSAVLYGEGYGAGIQKGGTYRKDKAFRLFDVLVDGKWWLDWLNTDDVARKLGIQTVPFLGRMTLAEITALVKNGFSSTVAVEDGGTGCLAEGVVARPIEPLFDKRGKRILLKLKTKDFGKQATAVQS